MIGTPLDWGKGDVTLVGLSDVFVVEQGWVDIFAVPTSQDHFGAWTNLGRLGAGAVLCGAPGGPRAQLLCRRVESAQVTRIPLDQVRETLAGDRLVREQMARGLDQTLALLSQAVRGDELPPRDFVAVEVGHEAQVRAGNAARCVDDVVWFDVREGAVRVDGSDRRAFSAQDRPFCVTQQDWVIADSTARIYGAATATVIGSADFWPTLLAHVASMLYAVDRMVEQAEARVLEQVKRRMGHDDATLGQLRDENDRLAQASRGGDPQWSLAANTHFAAVLRTVVASGHDPKVPQGARTTLERATTYETISETGWVRTRPITLEGDWWMQDVGPLVAEWGPKRQPVALIFDEGGYLALRADDRPLRITRKNRHNAKRTAWVVSVPVPGDVHTVGQLLRFSLAGGRIEVFQLLAIAVPIAILGLVTPVLNGRILGSFIAESQRSLVVQAFFGIVLCALAVAVLSGVQNLVVLRLTGRVTVNSQAAIWDRVLKLPVQFFAAQSAGRLSAVILGVKTAQERVTGLMVSSALGLVGAVANLILLVVLDWRLGLLSAVLAAVFVAACYSLFRRSLAEQQARHEAGEDLQGMSMELVSSVAKIRAAAAERRALQRWARSHREFHAHTLRANALEQRMVVLVSVAPAVGLGMVLVAAHLLYNGLPNLTMLLTFVTAFQLMIAAVAQMGAALPQVAAVVPDLTAVEPILTHEVESGVDRAQPGDLSGRVALRGVSFRYGDDGPLVIRELDLDVGPGEFVAIVGPSGSGKSTVLRLVLGFERPLAGSVLFDGKDLFELDVAAVRRQCGVVLQQAQLSSGSLREIIVGAGTHSDQEVWDAAAMAGIEASIRAMPMKLSTVASEGGFSGGERQRLLIARALINKPRLVIFDEATSALDNPTQRQVAEATRQLNAARIVVAHRLSTVRDADRIVVMDQGRVVQQGTYDELLAEQDGVFARLARTQTIEVEPVLG